MSEWLLSAKEFRESLKQQIGLDLKKSTLWRMLKTGTIRSARIGKTVYVRREEIERLRKKLYGD